MSQIKSYVRRNGRLSATQKLYLLEKKHYLYDKLPTISCDYVGLEIGFGTGDSLIDVAFSSPEQFWIGVEVYQKGIASVIGKALDMELDNIALRVADVHDVLEEIELNSISHVRIFFPDPWHKKRHHKRRLVNRMFLDRLALILKTGALVHFATDNLDYADSCKALVESHPQYEISNHVLERPLTKFAKKAMEKGILITDIVIKKL